MPHNVLHKLLQNYAEKTYHITKPNERDAVATFLCQVRRRPGTFEYALMNMFGSGLRARLGLAGPLRLADPSFKVPFSFIFGDVDWNASINKEDAEKLVELR